MKHLKRKTFFLFASLDLCVNRPKTGDFDEIEIELPVHKINYENNPKTQQGTLFDCTYIS